MIERTLVAFKPDAIQRQLVGQIMAIFEQAGLKIIAIKNMKASKELLEKHYAKPDSWLERVGGFVAKDYAAIGLNAKDALGTDTPIELGKIVIKQLVDYVSSTPIIAMILEGNCAVENVRRLVGATYPNEADPGSIRGRFCIDSKDLAAIEKRAVYNLVHASGELEEAKAEIDLWFPELKR